MDNDLPRISNLSIFRYSAQIRLCVTIQTILTALFHKSITYANSVTATIVF